MGSDAPLPLRPLLIASAVSLAVLGLIRLAWREAATLPLAGGWALAAAQAALAALAARFAVGRSMAAFFAVGVAGALAGTAAFGAAVIVLARRHPEHAGALLAGALPAYAILLAGEIASLHLQTVRSCRK